MNPKKEKYVELSRLMEQITRVGYGSLDDDDTMKLNSLYRYLINDLARTRRDYPGSQREKELNKLAAKVHNVILSGGRIQFSRVTSFFLRELPLSMRRHMGFIFIAILFFITGSIFSYLFINFNPDKAHYILDPMLIENAERGFETGHFEESGRMWHSRPLFVTFYVTNNTKVALTAFALGIFFALPTIIILFLNGLTMGGTVAIVVSKGLGHNLLAFISPHGGIELTAIFLASAAGMILGTALLNPGRLTRVAALKKKAYDVISLVIGAAVMLLIAGLIEGLVSPLPFDNRIKYLMGIVNLTLVLLYMFSGFFMKEGHDPEY